MKDRSGDDMRTREGLIGTRWTMGTLRHVRPHRLLLGDSMHTPPSAPASIASVFFKSLAPQFETLCRERYGGLLDLRPIDETEDLTAATVHFVMERPPHLKMKGTLVVRHVGGNVYDVQGIVDDNPETVVSFTHCLSEEARPTITSHLVQNLASHFLDTTERLLGRQFLQDHLRSPASEDPASSPPTRDQAKPKT